MNWAVNSKQIKPGIHSHSPDRKEGEKTVSRTNLQQSDHLKKNLPKHLRYSPIGILCNMWHSSFLLSLNWSGTPTGLRNHVSHIKLTGSACPSPHCSPGKHLHVNLGKWLQAFHQVSIELHISKAKVVVGPDQWTRAISWTVTCMNQWS